MSNDTALWTCRGVSAFFALHCRLPLRPVVLYNKFDNDFLYTTIQCAWSGYSYFSAEDINNWTNLIGNYSI